jgi:hypothetical protein
MSRNSPDTRRVLPQFGSIFSTTRRSESLWTKRRFDQRWAAGAATEQMLGV